MSIPNFPTNTPAIKALIINEIGRPVTFYSIYSSQACPNPLDSLDPVTNESTLSLCPTCSGFYWIPLWSGDTFTAHVTWKYADQKQWETVGILMAGDCQVKIMYSPANDIIAHDAKYLVVDTHIMDVEKITYRGAIEVDRIILDLKERTRS